MVISARRAGVGFTIVMATLQRGERSSRIASFWVISREALVIGAGRFPCDPDNDENVFWQARAGFGDQNGV